MVKIFFFNDTATTEICTLSLHDALPILRLEPLLAVEPRGLLHPLVPGRVVEVREVLVVARADVDRKSTRLNSSHANISYAVFCLKKKNSRRFSLFFSSWLRSAHHLPPVP